MSVVAALPARLRSDQTVSAIAEAVAEAQPDYWLQPIGAKEAAAFLGTTTGALSQARFRGNGPPCWGKVGGAVRYGSRLELLRWTREQAGLDAELPSERRAA
jgi:hypothetical protein